MAPDDGALDPKLITSGGDVSLPLLALLRQLLLQLSDSVNVALLSPDEALLPPLHRVNPFMTPCQVGPLSWHAEASAASLVLYTLHAFAHMQTDLMGSRDMSTLSSMLLSAAVSPYLIVCISG